MEAKNSAAVTSSILSKEDIARLLADRSTKAQIDVVEKLTEQYVAEGENALNAEQRAIANDIFRLLLTRGEAIVRAMLAMNLSQADKLPPELARQMARDINSEVAGPVLQYSEALTDDDLIGIISSMVDTEKLTSIARRSSVSAHVSDVLVSTHLDPVVSTLVQNEGASITEQTFEKIAKAHGGNAEVVEAIIQRNAIPAFIVEKVVSHLSQSMRQQLEQKYGNLVEMGDMKKALDQSIEVASLKMMGLKSSDKELMQLLRQLDENHKLSPFSALSMASLQLFEVSLSRLLHISLKNVQTLLQDSVGFRAAYHQAELPDSLFDATVLAMRAIKEIEQENTQKTGMKGSANAALAMERMRLLAAGKKVDGMDQLLAMMQHYLR